MARRHFEPRGRYRLQRFNLTTAAALVSFLIRELFLEIACTARVEAVRLTISGMYLGNSPPPDTHQTRQCLQCGPGRSYNASTARRGGRIERSPKRGPRRWGQTRRPTGLVEPRVWFASMDSKWAVSLLHALRWELPFDKNGGI